MMNTKGQTMGIAIIIAITIFIVGMLSVNFLKPEITRVRGADYLDCANTADFPDGISDGVKLTCLVTDLVVPYFIIIIFSAAGGLITARMLV